MSRPIPGFRLVLATWGGHGRLGDGRRLATGDVLIADPHAAHDYRIDAAHWHIAWFHLDRRWGGLGQGTRIRRNWPWAEQLARALRGASEAADAPGQLAAWCGVIGNLLGSLAGDDAPAPRLARLWMQVSEQLHRRWPISALAAEAGLSTAQLDRVCRREHGCGPAAMVTRLRLERAQLLRGDGSTLADIAPRVGYADAFILSKAWTRVLGSPARR
jgi:AraC-like DNA-binding protein